MDAVKYAMEHYFAEDGTMMLDPGQDRPPFPGFTNRTADNDNGVLYLAYFFYLAEAKGIELHLSAQLRIEDLLVDLMVRDDQGRMVPGLYHRNPGRVGRDEALDNLLAIAALSENHAKYICEYGNKNGWIFDNTKFTPDDQLDPHVKERRESKWYQALGFDITRWKQGSFVAFVKLASGGLPTLWELIWYIGGVLFNACQSTDHTSEHMMAWLQKEALKLQFKNEPLSNNLYYKILSVVHFVWEVSLRIKAGRRGMGVVFDKFHTGRLVHPNEMLADGVF